MSRGIENILDACLDRISLRGESVEQCLEAYPERAEELEPLLRAAAGLMEVSSIRPTGEFDRAGRARLLAAVAARNGEKDSRRGLVWGWQRGWTVAIASVLALVVAGGGTVAAASGSLPGDVLYPVKTATEEVRGFFTFGDEAKASFHIKMAERRLEEIESLIEKSRTIPTSVMGQMHAETDRVLVVLKRNERVGKELASRVVALTSDQKAVLATMQEAERYLDLRERLKEAFQRSEQFHVEATMLQRIIPELNDLRESPWGGDRGNGLWPQPSF